jgi:hypothetical protein
MNLKKLRIISVDKNEKAISFLISCIKLLDDYLKELPENKIDLILFQNKIIDSDGSSYSCKKVNHNEDIETKKNSKVGCNQVESEILKLPEIEKAINNDYGKHKENWQHINNELGPDANNRDQKAYKSVFGKFERRNE